MLGPQSDWPLTLPKPAKLGFLPMIANTDMNFPYGSPCKLAMKYCSEWSLKKDLFYKYYDLTKRDNEISYTHTLHCCCCCCFCPWLLPTSRHRATVREYKGYLLHNELSPSIHEVKLASPPFWGSTLFVSIPFGITNANTKKKCEKVCWEKN